MSPTRFRLQEVLDEHEVSQSELARRTGVAFSTISKMCRNVSAQVSLATLDAIAAALEIEPGELLERVGRAKRRP